MSYYKNTTQIGLKAIDYYCLECDKYDTCRKRRKLLRPECENRRYPNHNNIDTGKIIELVTVKKNG